MNLQDLIAERAQLVLLLELLEGDLVSSQAAEDSSDRIALVRSQLDAIDTLIDGSDDQG